MDININIFFIIVGLFILFFSIANSTYSCPPPRIEYRYIPRTLKEQMEEPVKVSEIFDNMFNRNDIFLYRMLDEVPVVKKQEQKI